MISYKHRFHGHNGLKFVYGNGKTIRTPLLSLRFVVNPKKKSYRCAVVVSKKISKSAVKRNRIRRRLYEAIRLSEPRMELTVDMVITVFDEKVAAMPATELSSAVSGVLEKAKITAAR